MKISVIIPVYNEEKTIADCIRSINDQSFPPHEVIVVDDGSKNSSKSKVAQVAAKNLYLLEQRHRGPAAARNRGVKKARGGILVFVDADMTFDRHFLAQLTKPIRERLAKGTFTKDEYVTNWDNVWARCWNFNANLATPRRIPKGYPNQAPVFRALLKREFDRVGGFDPIGYTDDWTLARKLGYQAVHAPGAITYHNNPESLSEVFHQARWIGKGEFISGTIFRRLFNLVRHSPPLSVIIGSVKAVRYHTPLFFIFKLVYDAGVTLSITGRFFDTDVYE